MLTIVGVFSFIPIFVFFNKVSRKNILAKTDIYLWLLFPISLAHGFLSTDVARMMYIFVAPIAIIIGLSIENNNYSNKIRSFFEV